VKPVNASSLIRNMVSTGYMSKNVEPTIKIGEKEVELNEDLYKIIHEHYRTGGTLDRLAEQLGLEGWDEAFQLVAGLPQWVLWFTQNQFEEHLKGAQKPHVSARRVSRRRRNTEEAGTAKEEEAKPPKEEKTEEGSALP
jgi:hypothetical protein